MVKKYIEADLIIKELKNGNERFFYDKSKEVDLSKEKREDLMKGQHPLVIIVGCSDSRVTLAHIFNMGLGQIFEVELAGNVVDKFSLASIEYAVEFLNVKLIMVLGHEGCGAVSAAYDKMVKGLKYEGNLELLTSKIAKKITKAKNNEEAAYININNTIKEIKENHALKKFIKEDGVKIIGAKYHLNGLVEFLD